MQTPEDEAYFEVERADKLHAPDGGLSPAGRRHFEEKDGSNLKPGVRSYDSASTADKKRWVNWASRFTKTPRPLKKPNGDPTPYALMFKAWGEKVPTSTADVRAVWNKAQRRKKTLGMGEHAMTMSDFAAEREAAKATPLDKKLYDQVVTEAKKKFNVYPSFYANIWVSNTYKKRGGKFKGTPSDKPAFLKSDTDAVPEGVVDPLRDRVADLPAGELPAPDPLEELPDTAPAPVEPASLASGGMFTTEARPTGDPATAKYTSVADRAKYAKSGVAMKDGKWPIPDASSLKDAIPWANTAATRAHVIKRAKALGLSKLLPDAWKTAPVKAFVTEHRGKTLITGPATTIDGGWETALNDNPHMLWMQGRLVGGDTPNRNKALWTAGDLELGNSTVAHGPLNWLHEARHVIGAIAGSNFVPASVAGPGESAAESVDSHIVAAASVWRWLYPDEAMVVEQASELNQLWYSMECVSDSVVCSGDNGCGTEISYVDYCTSEAAGCSHIQERSGIRRFANPTFLGAAVIVPPTRPGWADADARVMQQASVQAEKAFEQAGQPDIPATDFEQIVAQVLAFAG